LVLALAALFVYLRTQSQLTETIDDGLEVRGGELTALVAPEEDRSERLSAALTGGEDSYSQVLRPDGSLVASSLATGEPAVGEAALRAGARAPVYVDVGALESIDGDSRALVAPVDSVRGPLVLVVGASTEGRDEALTQIATGFGIGAPLALALAGALGYLLAARALRPVETMRGRAEEINLKRSGERLPLPEAEDELRRLGETLNAMLGRLEASLERERVFVADASHELRTPLAILRAELELAARPNRSREELAAAVASAVEEVDRLSRLAEDLLVIARADQGRFPIVREPVEARELLERVRRRFERSATEVGRGVTVDAPEGLRAELDVLRVEQALGNLIDNALRHGEGVVRISAHGTADLLAIEVTDEGNGFPVGFEEQAFERFSRPDSGRTGLGAGLGLAIVRAIAEAHGGTARVADSAAGAAVRLELPLHSAPA